MEVCSRPTSRPLMSVTPPPASRISSTPAAMSQGASLSTPKTAPPPPGAPPPAGGARTPRRDRPGRHPELAEAFERPGGDIHQVGGGRAGAADPAGGAQELAEVRQVAVEAFQRSEERRVGKEC